MYMYLFCLILFFGVKSHTVEKEMKGAEEKKLSLWLNSNRDKVLKIFYSVLEDESEEDEKLLNTPQKWMQIWQKIAQSTEG